MILFKIISLRFRLLIRITQVIFSFGSIPSDASEKKNNSLAYSIRGNGKKVIVFIHGWGQSKETWSSLMDKLQHTYTLYAIDLPLFGKSNDPQKALKINEYAQLVNSFLDTLNIKKVILVGHSFGGKVATALAHQYPDKIEKLVLYSTDFNAVTSTQDKLLYACIKFFQTPSLKPFFNFYLLIRRKKYHHFLLLLKTMQYSLSMEVEPILRTLTCNTSLLYGRYDFITSTINGEKAKELIKNSKLVVFNDSTHLAHEEEQQLFLKTLTLFIENN